MSPERNLALQLMNNNFERAAIDRLERVGFIMRPALLETRSLATELAGVVNNADSWLQSK